MALTRFADVVTLSSTRTADPLAGGIERFVGLEHIEPENLHIRSWGKVAEGTTFTSTFKRGQVLFGKRRAYQRKVAVAEFGGVCSSDIYVFESKDPDLLLPELLPFICQSEGFYQYAIKTSAGSLSPRTNWSHLANYEFPLPTVHEQRRIADLLWAADDSLQECGALIQSINQLIVSYRDSFFNNSHDWKKEQLGKLYEIKLGKMVSPKSRQGISPRPFMSNANVQWGRIDLTEEVKEMDFTNEEFEKNRLRYGDLLVCEGGEVGRSAIWRDELPECGYQKAIHRLRPITEDLPPEVLLQFMFFAASRGLFAKFTGQSTIAHFPAERLRLLEILVPPKENQDEFLNVLGEMENSRLKAEQHWEETKNLKKALLKILVEGA
jgi:type I restriction enzyme, S subunit